MALRNLGTRALLGAVAGLALCTCTPVVAETVIISGQPVQVQPRFAPQGQPQMHQGAVTPQPQATPQGGPQGGPPGAKEGEAKKGEDSSKKTEEEKKPESVERPKEPPRAPDPRELEAELVNGKVPPFNFIGQPWPDVLQWLANVSGYSLDWQELPADYLNLTTQRSYTLHEARDLINRHLQARGYVMLLAGEVLSVFKLENLDPSLLPTITEVELYDRQPHDFVKVVFVLPSSMDPAQAAKDFEQVLSKNKRILPLAATKRVLAIDAVANLRMVSQLLNAERLKAEGHEIPRRFLLKHVRAEKIINTLYVVLGLDPASQPSQMELQVQMQKMQLMQQLQKKGKDVSRMLNRDGPRVYLAYNRQENSILVNAPEEQLQIIERTIAYLDIPPAGATRSEAPGVIGQRVPRTYELESIRPESLQVTLEEIGDLHPLTDLRADSQAKILFVRGTEEDHAKVKQIIDDLDQGQLEFEVFQLRRHPADAVAGTVMALLGETEEKEEDNDPYGYFYNPYPRRQQQKKEPKLRVDADLENNRLLVYGSEEQIEAVRNLLKKLGELGGANLPGEAAIRVYEPLDTDKTQELLKQLRSAWPAIGGGSELLLEEPESKEDEEQESPPRDRSTSLPAPGARFHLLGAEQDAPEQAESTPADEQAGKPPVSVTVTPDGRIVLMSDDPAAVQRAEDLLNTLSPREEQFHEFKIEHTDVYNIWYDLRDYFKDELKGGEKEVVRDWYGRMREFGKEDTGMSLARRRKLNFLYIIQTNSIIAANATPEQLDTIKKLIRIWDQPPRAVDIRNRRTGMVKVHFSSPTKIANALREVYRDLLSSRDKEFESQEGRSGSGYTTAKTTQVEFAGVDRSGGPVSTTQPIRLRFDGALSIGVDEVSGMLLISATTEIYEGVVRMVRLLDQEAKPNNTIAVHRVRARNVESVRQALSATAGAVWVGGIPEQPGAQQNQRQGNGRPNQRGDRNRRRGRGGRG